ncbi:DNA-packaging protein [Alphaproteobacteria bacterium]|nr:DNA-packaging protein [Alphaproteobacteria bacterium]
MTLFSDTPFAPTLQTKVLGRRQHKALLSFQALVLRPCFWRSLPFFLKARQRTQPDSDAAVSYDPAFYDWAQNARDNQKVPPGDWKTWLILAGRGFGKTRTGAETVRHFVTATPGSRRIALISQTMDEARNVMIEGVSGLLSVYPPRDQEAPRFEVSTHCVRWPNGAVGHLFGADHYEHLRGPQFDLAWVDELAKFRYPDCLYEQLMLGLRLGDRPRCIISTTPRPLPLLKTLMTAEDTVLTRGTTFENAANLAPSFIASVQKQFGDSPMGRQELYADLLEENRDALWARRHIRYRKAANLVRVVVAVDPAVTYHEESDETGIIIAGKNGEGQAFVLDDASGRYHPNDWGRKVVQKFHEFQADRVVAEVNQGGALVEGMLRSFDATLPYAAVHATRGKWTRAEPMAALYEQGRVFHDHPLYQLEQQMCAFAPGKAAKSPDRVDALVWALTELFGREECIVRAWG